MLVLFDQRFKSPMLISVRAWDVPVGVNMLCSDLVVKSCCLGAMLVSVMCRGDKINIVGGVSRTHLYTQPNTHGLHLLTLKPHVHATKQ